MYISIFLIFSCAKTYPIANHIINKKCVFNICFENDGLIPSTFNHNGYYAKFLVNSTKIDLIQLQNDFIIFNTTIQKISINEILVTHQINNFGHYDANISLGIYADVYINRDNEPQFEEISKMDGIHMYNDNYSLFLFFSPYTRINSLYYGERINNQLDDNIFQNSTNINAQNPLLAYSWQDQIMKSNESKSFQVLFSSKGERYNFKAVPKFYQKTNLLYESSLKFSKTSSFTESSEFVIAAMAKGSAGLSDRVITIIIGVCVGFGVLICICLVIILHIYIKKKQKTEKKPQIKQDESKYDDFDDGDLNFGL